MGQSSNLWSPEEVRFLISRFDELTTAQLAQAIGRSMTSIRVQASRLHLSARAGREKVVNMKSARTAFLRDPCMVTPSSKVGEYWSRHTH
jgi:hypothetical protein